MDMILQAELKEYLNLYNKKTLTFLQLAFLLLLVTDYKSTRSGYKFIFDPKKLQDVQSLKWLCISSFKRGR